MVVRYEVDARTSTSGSAPSYTPSFSPNAFSPKVIRAGECVAQEDIVEIKSATGNGVSPCPRRKINDATAQLVLSATQRLHTGTHREGSFYMLEEHACDEQALLASRPREVASLRKLHRVLCNLKNAVRLDGTLRRLSVVHGKGEPTLSLYEGTSLGPLIPAMNQERFVQVLAT